MPRRRSVHPSDLRAATRLVTDATAGLTDLVEAVHERIARVPVLRPASPDGRTRGITGLVYGSVRGVTRLVGGSLDALLGQVEPALGDLGSTPEREALLAALNGVLGDYLLATDSPLAIPMTLRRGGRPLSFEPGATAGGRILVLVHGLCRSDLQWRRDGHDHGAALARDLGWEPVYAHYNSGLHVSLNGRALAGRLERLVGSWPAPARELAILGHSMGGLLARSAFHYGALAGHAWPSKVSRLVFLGTPHHGAPLERAGHWIDILLDATPYASPFARLGRVRSAGITDLRHGCLLDEEWVGQDRFAWRGHSRPALPLPEGVACYALAATTGRKEGDVKDRVLGDGLVPLDSALGRHPDPRLDLGLAEDHRWVGTGMGHLGLLSRPEVYERLRSWLR